MFRRWHQVTGLALTAALITSCGGDKEPEGPTVTEAEQALKSHINKLVGTGVGNVRHVKVIDPGGRNIPCEKGGAKRTYAISGDKKDPKKDDQSRNQTDLASFLHGMLITQVADYRLTEVKGKEPMKKLHNPTTRTNLTISVPAKGEVHISGSTDCLRTG